jgi:preprotein translocase subunit SecG
MIKVLLVLHVFVTIALIGVVLIQRSEGGGLGLGAGQGMGSFMTGRGTANLLTRTTAILATAFPPTPYPNPPSPRRRSPHPRFPPPPSPCPASLRQQKVSKNRLVLQKKRQKNACRCTRPQRTRL